MYDYTQVNIMKNPSILINDGTSITVTGDQSVFILGQITFFGNVTETRTKIEVEKIPKYLQNAFIQVCLSLYNKNNKVG